MTLPSPDEDPELVTKLEDVFRRRGKRKNHDGDGDERRTNDEFVHFTLLAYIIAHFLAKCQARQKSHTLYGDFRGGVGLDKSYDCIPENKH